MKILATSAVGYSGVHSSIRPLAAGHRIFDINNLNDCDDVRSRQERLVSLGDGLSKFSSWHLAQHR